MPEGLKNVLDRITQLWTGLDNTKKLAIGGVLAAVVIAFIAMAGYSSKPSKELLYDNLSATDYASISKALEAMGVEYSGSGTSAIYVDGHRRQEIVTKLAQENL
ncbi:MAG TPA: flagellar M-ring protein FliF, partial [Leptospiraceae bacterium]|nr:flagellar M-ring protein FliF [Leptospiraceae bacterium]